MRARVAELERQRADVRSARRLQAGAGGILELLATGASLSDVLHRLVELVERLRPEMIGSVLVLDRERDCLRHGAAPSLPAFYNDAVDGLMIGPAAGSCGTCAYTGERIIVEDIATHPYWKDYTNLARRAGLGACWSHPITSSTGGVLGTFAMYYRQPRRPSRGDLQLITLAAHVAGIAIERAQTQETLHASEQRFRAIIESAPVCIVEIDPSARLLSMNPAGLALLGASDQSEIVGKHYLDCVAEDQRQRVQAHLQGAMAGARRDFEFTAMSRHGPRDIAASFVPIRDDTGAVVKLIGVARDITERKEDERRRTLMVQELDHRVKNNLARVLSIAEQTLEGVASLDEFREAFSGRIRSLAAAHEMLAQAHWGSVRLAALLARILEPYRQGGTGRITFTGPPVAVPPGAASPICMVAHELAVNAAKHGALSSATGCVRIEWQLTGNGLHLAWTESGGPPVSEPARRGRGTNLIERMVSHQLHGTAGLDFRPEGVRCHLEIPLAPP